jgi:hypothetical protein
MEQAGALLVLERPLDALACCNEATTLCRATGVRTTQGDNRFRAIVARALFMLDQPEEARNVAVRAEPHIAERGARITDPTLRAGFLGMASNRAIAEIVRGDVHVPARWL